VHNEQSLIAAFVKRSKRDRYREMLSTPRLRHKFIHQLAHFADFDFKYRLPIPSNKLFVENSTVELLKRRSPNVVFAISEDPSLDQKELPLVEALPLIVGRGMGTILSCIPGRLAFVETDVTRHSNRGKCTLRPRYGTQIAEFRACLYSIRGQSGWERPSHRTSLSG
jgi:hypothetical protein